MSKQKQLGDGYRTGTVKSTHKYGSKDRAYLQRKTTVLKDKGKSNRRTTKQHNGDSQCFPRKIISILELPDEDNQALPDREFKKKNQ